MLIHAFKKRLSAKVNERRTFLVDLCSRLVQIPSVTPPSDTRAIAQAIAEILRHVEGVDVTLHTMETPITNVVARIRGNGPGRRLVFNGHLDTFSIGDQASWTVDPFAGIQKDGRLYGRGVADMKAGIACSMLACIVMAECRESWSGEIVLTLGGDEENMGYRGTHYLLDTVPHATGDAMISGDVGSPLVVHFGEKGLLWLELCASGKSAHGAHIHRGENAIERLIDGISRIKECLKAMEIDTPEKIIKSIKRAESEDDIEVLQTVTTNFGVISGGISHNLVPARATAGMDIRVPVGLSVAQVEQRIKEVLDPFPWFSSTILQQYEPNWSNMDHEIFSFLTENIQEVMKQVPVVTLRIGASDGRLYRLFKGVPSANCGLTAYNLGGPDEYIEVSELVDVAKIHTLTACDFLFSSHPDILK